MFEIKRFIPVSATVTMGYGSERHNTDPVARAELPHVDGSKLDVIHLHPYVNYKERINELARSYIETYNRRRDEAYAAALQRYQEGEIKEKPRKNSYKHKSYDYYSRIKLQHVRSTGKREIVPPYRSVIIHIGDREDRCSGRIKQECAIAIFKALLEEFERRFPLLVVLGAVVHTGEYGDETHSQLGGWHMHIDYLPVYDMGPEGKGVRMGTGFDEAFKRMGYVAEDSIIINHHRPLMFNTFRNGIYRSLESILPEYGFRLRLGVTAIKQPDKNPSEPLPMPDWQAHKRETADVQATKNRWLDILLADEVSPDAVKQALGSLAIAQDAMRVIQRADKTWDGSAYKIRETDYTHLRGAIETMMDTMAHVVSKAEQADARAEQVDDLTQQLAAVQSENTRLEQEVARLRRYDLDRHIKAADAERRCLDLQRTIDRMVSFMRGFEVAGRKLYDLYGEMFDDDKDKGRE